MCIKLGKQDKVEWAQPSAFGLPGNLLADFEKLHNERSGINHHVPII